jgi:hypothetical protein
MSYAGATQITTAPHPLKAFDPVRLNSGNDPP